MKEETYVVLLGAPGAGKGTQAVALAEHLGIAHVSSGDLFRYNLSQGTELGILAKSYMELATNSLTLSVPQAHNGCLRRWRALRHGNAW